MLTKEMFSGLYGQQMEETHPLRKSNTRDHLICRCGRKKKIIYSRGVDHLHLFIEGRRLAPRKTKKVRCKEKKMNMLRTASYG